MWWPRGWRCWWWYANPYLMYPPYALYYPLPPFTPPPPSPEQEIEALEAYRAELEEELKSVEARIKELRESLKSSESGTGK